MSDTTTTFPVTEIPRSYVDFAKAVANLAEAHGIKRLQVKIEPSFDTHRLGISSYGEMQIVFASIDGRGRPARNLKIQMMTNLTHSIESNPESFS